MREYDNNGFEMTKSFEGLSLTAYKDVAGVWTIGYGHTGTQATSGNTITELEAEVLLRNDVAAAVACVNHAVNVPINQHQFDALVDFSYNVGCGAFHGSTLLRKLNDGNFSGAAEQFALWVHAGNAVAPGLVRRRKAEAELFLSACPDGCDQSVTNQE